MNLKSLAASRLAGRPWAMAPARLEGLLGNVAALSTGNDLPPWLQEIAQPRGYTITESGIAVVPVLGPLVARGDWLTAILGATEYGSIVETVSMAADDPAVRGIVLEVDSPGGEVGGLFDLVDAIGAIRQRSAKPVWAIASEAALSAAYAIASAADRFYVTRTGEVGSVGVVAVHIDESGADAMAGLKWTLIHAGARKTDGNPHEPLSPRATAEIQADVDALYDQLVALVAANRGLNAAAIRATEAAVYRGERTVKAGLADRVGTVPQAIADLEAALEAKRIRTGPPQIRTAVHQSPLPARIRTMNSPDLLIDDTGEAPSEDAAGNTEIISDLPKEGSETPPETAPPDRPSAAPVPDAHAIADRLRGEFSEIATVAAQAARLGIEIDAADAMGRGLKPDALRRTILDRLAARSEAADVVAIAPQPSTGSAARPTGDSPIIRRARERAAAGSR
ncbi:MAG TPA: S49 family peptidase [Rhodospirillales bacterium]|nr:S49 family peptidase [Rhodospirillales bacterium]